MYDLTQLFSVSMYWMWIYDYFLTLGDEVRRPCVLSTEVPGSDRCTDRIRLAWKEILE